MKKIFYLLIFIISVPFVLTFIVNAFYDQKIKNEIIKKINYNPEDDVEIGEIKFSLIKRFPNGTLTLITFNHKKTKN